MTNRRRAQGEGTIFQLQRVRPSTLSNYRRDFERHIRPGIGRHRLDALGPEHLSRFYATRLSQGMSAYAVRYLHAEIRRALGVAVTWGLLSRNVATSVQPPRCRITR